MATQTLKRPREPTPLYICLDSSDDVIEQEVLGGVAQVQMLGATSASELDDEVLKEAEVVAVWHTIRVDAALLARLPRCRAVVRMGVGYDNVEIKAAGALGIPVCNIPDYGTEEVADTALALTLGLYRGTLAGASLLAHGASFRGADAIAGAIPYIRRVRGSTLGLVGLGRIGSAMALRAKACGFDVAFFDPYREDGADKALGIRREPSLRALLASSDCVSLHCNPVAAGADPAASCSAPENYIDASCFDAMKDGAFLVNTARGELVHEAALAGALRSGKVAAAALDVHWSEPFVAGQGPLAGAPNLWCTPHSAWYSPESRAEMRRKGALAAAAAIRGEAVRNVVNAQYLDPSAMAARAERG